MLANRLELLHFCTSDSWQVALARTPLVNRFSKPQRALNCPRSVVSAPSQVVQLLVLNQHGTPRPGDAGMESIDARIEATRTAIDKAVSKVEAQEELVKQLPSGSNQYMLQLQILASVEKQLAELLAQLSQLLAQQAAGTALVFTNLPSECPSAFCPSEDRKMLRYLLACASYVVPRSPFNCLNLTIVLLALQTSMAAS
jgi:hypothetical protein